MSTIGILQCDSVLEQHRDPFNDYPEMFMQLFARIDPDMKCIIYDVRLPQYPEYLDVCDAYLITGSKASVYDDLPWLDPLKTFIQELNNNKKPLIGICFGHQLIADILGGKTEKSVQGWGVGIASNTVIKKMEWMKPIADNFNLIVSHQDQVTTLPKNALCIASSHFCPYFMYVINQHILGIQGHPEYNKAYSEVLLQHRASILGTKIYQSGLASLDKQTDEFIVAQWIAQFIKQ